MTQVIEKINLYSPTINDQQIEKHKIASHSTLSTVRQWRVIQIMAAINYYLPYTSVYQTLDFTSLSYVLSKTSKTRPSQSLNVYFVIVL